MTRIHLCGLRLSRCGRGPRVFFILNDIFLEKYFNDSTKYFFGELQMSDMWCLHQLKIFEVAAVSRIELLQLGKNLLGMCEHQKSSKAQDIISVCGAAGATGGLDGKCLRVVRGLEDYRERRATHIHHGYWHT